MSKVDEKQNETRILVLFTGGTIGMIKGPSGSYRPCPNQLEAKLRTIPQLHDKTYSPDLIPSGPLVLPNSSSSDDERVLYTVYEYEPLLDSSDMTMDDWVRIALDIKRFYNSFDGFVILHGTDTMAFTASALSFMLEGLNKPIVVTGSQIPIFETRTDGQDNFQGALIMAAHYVIPEVSVYFNHRLYRGNRTTKVSTDKLNAFDSPNMRPLVKIGVDIDVDWKSVLRVPSNRPFTVHTNLYRDVSILTIFPSISLHTVKAHFEPPIKGVVLQSFGAGNIPTSRTDLLQELKDASNRGVIIVNITQCLKGSIAPLYETGKPLLEAGIIPGADLTTEAALTKLTFVLGRDDWDLETKRNMMKTDLRGEMSVSRVQIKESKNNVLAQKFWSPLEVCDAIVNSNTHLITEQYQLECLDTEMRTPIHLATLLGQLNVIHFLLQSGVKVNAVDKWCRTPMDYAIISKHHHLVNLLHQYGGYQGDQLNQQVISEAISSAAACGDVEALKIYKLLGFDLNLKNSIGRTTLHQAVLNNHLNCVEFLLITGANPLIQDTQGFSSCDLAMRLGLNEIQQSLQKFTLTNLLN